MQQSIQACDFLYLSPHLDDAALSCGGQIYQAAQAGKTVAIVTVMAGDPPEDGDPEVDTPHRTGSELVAELHARWALAEDAVAARRAEDRAACALLGATAYHLSVPDCIYRHAAGQFFYRTNDEIFGAIHLQEMALIDGLAQEFQRLPGAGQIFVPLGVGHHVDHLLVRAAAEKAWGVARLTYYEEYPYAETPQALATTLVEYPPPADQIWVARPIPLAPQARTAKGHAIAAYRSQISTFFADTDELHRRIAKFAAARGGECLWFARLPT